ATFGSTINVSWVGSNQGTRRTNTNWYDAIYLSTDNVYDGSDTLLYYEWANANPLGVGLTYPRAHDVAVPINNTLAEGTYYLFAVADRWNYQVESGHEDNNVSDAHAI